MNNKEDVDEVFLLDDALQIALHAHANQVDKSGEPYILHVIRVMIACSDSRDAMIVAALHDVVEDSSTSIEYLAKRFPDYIVKAVDDLTRRKAEQDYNSYIDKLSSNPLARTVKIADLKDNMDIERSKRLAFECSKGLTRGFLEEWTSLRRRYSKALSFLESLP